MAVGINVNGGYNQIDSLSSPYSLNGQFSPEIAAEEQALNRRQQIANLLMQRGLQSPQGQMAGRFYVAPSWVQGLSQLGSAAAGASLTKANDADRAGLADKQRDITAQAVQNFIGKTQGQEVKTPAEMQGPLPLVPAAEDMPEAGGPQRFLGPGGKPMMEQPTRPMGLDITMQPPNERDYRKAIVDAMTSGVPGLKEIAMWTASQREKAQDTATQREFLKEEKALDRDARLHGQEVQLNQALMMGLITKDQKDQLLAMQKQADQDRASHNKATEQLQRQQLELEKQKIGQGKTPPGYRQTPEGNLEAIPGGPADLKMQGALNQDTATLNASRASLKSLAEAANELKNHPGLKGITGIRGAIPNIPGTDAADAQALLNTLKSKVGFGVLQDMRNNSKTGGALGSVSDAEGKRLEANLAALENAQSLEQMITSLDKIGEFANEADTRLNDAYNMKHKNAPATTAATQSGAPAKITGDADFDKLPSGALFIGPDGVTRKKP